MKTKHLVNELRILLNNSKPIRNYSQIEELVNIIDQSLDIQVKEEEIMAIIDNPIEFTELTKEDIELFLTSSAEVEDEVIEEIVEVIPPIPTKPKAKPKPKPAPKK